MIGRLVAAVGLFVAGVSAGACGEEEPPTLVQGCEETEVVAPCIFDSCPDWQTADGDRLLECATACHEELDENNGGPYILRANRPSASMEAVACLSDNEETAELCTMQCPVDPPSSAAPPS